MVSELPIITAAQKAGKLSAPELFISSEKDAIEALPEKGLVIRSVKSSEGMPRRAVIGSITVPIASSTPEADSILTPTIMATREGISPKETESPSFAPSLKESKLTFFPKSIKTEAMPITIGTESAAIFSIRDISTICVPFRKYGKGKGQERHRIGSISILEAPRKRGYLLLLPCEDRLL